MYTPGYFIFNDVLKSNSTAAAIAGNKADNPDEKKG